MATIFCAIAPIVWAQDEQMLEVPEETVFDTVKTWIMFIALLYAFISCLTMSDWERREFYENCAAWHDATEGPYFNPWR